MQEPWIVEYVSIGIEVSQAFLVDILILISNFVPVSDKRVVCADRGTESTIHIIILQACVEFENQTVVQGMHGETLSASRFRIRHACFVIVKLNENGRCVGHISWVVAHGLQEFQHIPDLGVVRRVHVIAHIVIRVSLV